MIRPICSTLPRRCLLTKSSPSKIVLYQYNICPFCNRVKAFLDYQNLPYSVIEVNPLNKTEIQPFKSQHKQVPIAQIDEQPVFGSDKIINELLNNHTGQHEFQCKDESEQPWVNFAVTKLAVLLYPNMCGSWADSYRAFDYVNQTPSFSPIQRILIQNIGSLAMYFAASKVKKKHNITDERKALEEVLKVLDAELQGSMFLSKSTKPDLGDLAVYGTLRAIEGLPFHDTVVMSNHQPIAEWYHRMKALTPSKRVDH